MPAYKFQPLKASTDGFSIRSNDLRKSLSLLPITTLVNNTGCDYHDVDSVSGYFSFAFFNNLVMCKHPEFIFLDQDGGELPEFQQLLFLYYFSVAEGSTQSESFVSFAELPGGRIYDKAFQGYSGDEITKTFGNDLLAFCKSCENCGGERQLVADASYEFVVFPKIRVQLIYWLGDDEFPSSAKILFDSSVTKFVPIEACAIIGSTLARRLNKNFVSSILDR